MEVVELDRGDHAGHSTSSNSSLDSSSSDSSGSEDAAVDHELECFAAQVVVSESRVVRTTGRVADRWSPAGSSETESVRCGGLDVGGVRSVVLASCALVNGPDDRVLPVRLRSPRPRHACVRLCVWATGTHSAVVCLLASPHWRCAAVLQVGSDGAVFLFLFCVFASGLLVPPSWHRMTASAWRSGGLVDPVSPSTSAPCAATCRRMYVQRGRPLQLLCRRH